DPAASMLAAPRAEVDAALAELGATTRPFAVVSLRNRPDPPEIGAVAELVHQLAQRGVACVAIPQCTEDSEDDRRVHATVAAQAPGLLRLESLPPDDVIRGIVGRSVLAVGSRYHLSVFAATAGVPAIALVDGPYTERKAEGAAAFGPGMVTILPVTVPADTLIAAADAACTPAPTRPVAPLDVIAPALPAIERFVGLLGSGRC
ncbi:MAG: hypothetical protein ACKOBG_04450, partial [Actinomycetota bacterium]